MSLRDLVAAECAEPNPLARFVNTMTGQRQGSMFQDKWVDRDEVEPGRELHPNALNRHGFDRRQRDLADLQHEDELYYSDEEDEFRNLDKNAGLFDVSEYEEMGRRESGRPGFAPRPDGMLSAVFQSFIHGARSKELIGPMNFNNSEMMKLTDGDKAKIRDRMAVLGRQIYANENPEFADKQMDALMHTLELGGSSARRPPWATNEEMDAAWRQGHQQMRAAPPPGGRAWAAEFQRGPMHYPASSSSTSTTSGGLRHQNRAWIEEYSHYGPLGTTSDLEHSRPEGRQWADDYLGSRTPGEIEQDELENAWEDASHDRIMEAAWKTADQTTKNGQLSHIEAALAMNDDPKFQKSNFAQFLRKIQAGKVEFDETNGKMIEHPGADSTQEQWLRDYNDFEGASSYDRVRELSGQQYEDPMGWGSEYQSFKGELDPAKLLEYQYVLNEDANPYSTHANPFSAGVDLFNQGMITEAILALEAEVQRNPNNSQAWLYLGQAHAENDKDGQAIFSLEKAVQVDPQNLQALAALAVSYTNDFNKYKALDALETWLRRSAEYAHIASSEPFIEDQDDFMAWGRHTRIADMFLEAARLRPTDPDPEVQTALGLLYNLSYEYDKAVDCFKAALTKRPDDYLLWNKLGATLANSNRSEEALDAYTRALEQKPTYVRARANLGISYLALNSYREAAQSFLSALRLHPNASHLWDSLKMVFNLMQRPDLRDKAAHGNIDDFKDSDF
eukprot:TRINITY_DN9902_c0_g1_i2.p1 TRINITY_DN9902_c0_g1~~TRINITY_DN9902_c0_g1_i2.p1  ORF type:complete len:732 (-),score=215.62 TRINITY_DN9902_c0_g1_i2:44-2239(-)